MTTTQRRAIAVLGYPAVPTAVPDHVNPILDSIELDTNGWFKDILPLIAPARALVVTLVKQNSVVVGHTKGAAEQRDATDRSLHQSMDEITAKIQVGGDNDVANADARFRAAGLGIQGYTHPGPRPFVRKGKPAKAGEVILHVPSGGHSASYTWELSINGGKDWTLIRRTTTCETTATGLTVGVTYQFRCTMLDNKLEHDPVVSAPYLMT
jgi:hypothetical protein